MTKHNTMTKSLHTITAVKNVAAHLSAGVGSHYSTAEALTAHALAVLGYEYTATELKTTTDDTLQRCVAAVRSLGSR